MANEFKKLTEKEVVESVSENGHLFAEDGGKIVRVPAAGVGGGELVILYFINGNGALFVTESGEEELTYESALALVNNPNVRLKQCYYPKLYTPVFTSAEDNGVEFTIMSVSECAYMSFEISNPDAGPQ